MLKSRNRNIRNKNESNSKIFSFPKITFPKIFSCKHEFRYFSKRIPVANGPVALKKHENYDNCKLRCIRFDY